LQEKNLRFVSKKPKTIKTGNITAHSTWNHAAIPSI